MRGSMVLSLAFRSRGDNIAAVHEARKDLANGRVGAGGRSCTAGRKAALTARMAWNSLVGDGGGSRHLQSYLYFGHSPVAVEQSFHRQDRAALAAQSISTADDEDGEGDSGWRYLILGDGEEEDVRGYG